MEPKSFTLGRLVGNLLSSMRSGDHPDSPEQQPIAYLYNGVRLPALPEWDREKNPYAFIYYYDGLMNQAYNLYVSAEIFYDGSSIGVSGGYQSFFRLEGGPAKWVSSTSGEKSRVCSITSVMWANFDVMGENGAVVLEKSAPIPIYE